MKILNQREHSPALSRFFSIAGLFSLVLTAVFLSLLFRKLAITALVEFGEKSNIVVAQTALNSVEPELTRFLEQRASIRANDVFDPEIPQVLRDQLHKSMGNTSVVRIKIYNQHGIVVYSTKRSQIGRDTHRNPGFQGAMLGQPKSRLAYGDTFNLWDEEAEDDNLIQTYVPVRPDPWTPVLGVFEIYTDVSNLVEATEHLQLLMVVGVVLALTLLYWSLLYIQRRGDKIISAQRDTILARTKTLELLSARMLTAEEKERRRIAQKLHEGVAQTLSALKLQVESTCTHTCAMPPEQRASTLDPVVNEIREAIQEVRAMAMELHPPSLDDIGLLGTINWACREFESIYPHVAIETAFEATEEQIPSPLKTIIFRVVQEILTTIGEQAKANNVRIWLHRLDNSIRLIVEDNGLAYYAPGTQDVSETGMASPRERTVLSGGSFTMNSNQQGGTRYQAVWST